jgi:hypothetical protein
MSVSLILRRTYFGCLPRRLRVRDVFLMRFMLWKFGGNSSNAPSLYFVMLAGKSCLFHEGAQNFRLINLIILALLTAGCGSS